MTPKIGERWPGIEGIYAGVARGQDGEPDGHLILLDSRPSLRLNDANATVWAEGLGNGARLPTQFESALLYANLRDHIDTAGWYWTSTLDSGGGTWYQNFYHGGQGVDYTGCEGRAVAVRRIPVATHASDVDRLAELLREAATTFRHYETLHRAKGTADSEAKAAVNADIAGRIEAALAVKGDHP